MPYFSIVVPSYNREKLIGSTIRSVFSQTFDNWELIIVDDGSSDDTKSVVDSFKSEKLIYIYQDNAERGAARNHGVRRSTGKYTFFLDSDDIIYPNHLELAYENLQRLREPEFFHVRYEEIKGHNNNQVQPLDKATIRDAICRQNQFACQFFLRRDIAKKFPFSENRKLQIGEDWNVILKIAARYTLHFTNEVGAAIVQHGERSMQTASPSIILRSRDIILRDLKNDAIINKNLIILENVFYEMTSLAALSAALHKQRGLAIELLFRSAKTKPLLILTRRFFATLKHLASGKK